MKLFRGRSCVQIDTSRPIPRKEIAWNTHIEHHVHTIQPKVPILALLNPPPKDHFTGNLGGVASKVAGTRGVATTGLQYVTPYMPGSLCCHDSPPLASLWISDETADDGLAVFCSHELSPLKPNAGAHLRLEAGATQERTL